MSGWLSRLFDPSVLPQDYSAPPNQLGPLAQQVMRNPVGTETTSPYASQSVGVPQGPFNPIEAMTSSGQPILGTDMDRARAAVARGMQEAPAMVLGMVGDAPGGKLGGMKPVTAYHGSLEDFTNFDPTKVGTGGLTERWAPGTKHADEYYLATNPEQAKPYGPFVHEFQIDRPLLQKDAKAELETWAKDEGYDSAQAHLDNYYDGDIYQALDLDNYMKDALNEAKQAGMPGAHISFGDLKIRRGDRKVPAGDFIVLHDPSAATKIGTRRDD